MKICDSHLHSEFSSDSSTPVSAVIEKAIALGLPKVCITDHYDIDFVIQDESDPTMDFKLDTPSYLACLKEMSELYKDKIDVRFGVELGLMPGIEEKVRNYVSKWSEYDFIIGSTHLVRGLDPYYPSYYEGRSSREALREYFECILTSVRTFDDFDVYGHLDYIVRYLPGGEKDYCFKDHADIFEEIFKVLISKGKGIEINTGSLYKKMTFPHPHIEALKMYKAMGGEIITVGSDAHVTDYICYGFETVVKDLLTSLGYKYYTTFKNRKPEFNPI